MIDPNWAFCPYCGQDNRPPAERVGVPNHAHRFLGNRGCCVRCGEPSDEPYNMSRKWRLRLAGLSLGTGLLMGLAALVVQVSHRTGNGPFAMWVASWYSVTAHHYRSHRRGGPYDTLQGDDVTLYLTMGAVAFVVVSLWMFFKLPAPERNDDTWDGDADWKPLRRNR